MEEIDTHLGRISRANSSTDKAWKGLVPVGPYALIEKIRWRLMRRQLAGKHQHRPAAAGTHHCYRALRMTIETG